MAYRFFRKIILPYNAGLRKLAEKGVMLLRIVRLIFMIILMIYVICQVFPFMPIGAILLAGLTVCYCGEEIREIKKYDNFKNSKIRKVNKS